MRLVVSDAAKAEARAAAQAQVTAAAKAEADADRMQRSHLIGQQKKLRADVESMRTDLQALPLRTASRTAQQRLLEAERSLAELDAIYSAQNRNAEVRKPCHLQLPIALAPTQEPPPTAALNRSLSLPPAPAPKRNYPRRRS